MLKNHWGVDTAGLIAIMASFSCTGTSILFIRKPLFDLLHITHLSMWLKVVIYPFIMVPLFYLILLVFGTIFGQRIFFWNRVKRMVAFVGRKK